MVLFAIGVGECGEEVRIAQSAAHIFGRAGVLSIIAANSRSRLHFNVLVFDDHDVMPVIFEVIHIVEAASIDTESCAQRNASLINVIEVLVGIRIRFAVSHPANDELMQVTIRPADRNLKHLVQFGQLDRRRNDQTTPYRWDDVEQLDFELPGPGGVVGGRVAFGH